MESLCRPLKLLFTAPFNYAFQLRVSHKSLYTTFDSREQTEAYGTYLNSLLAQDIVLKSLLEHTKFGQEIWAVSRCISECLRASAVPVSDTKLLHTIRLQLATLDRLCHHCLANGGVLDTYRQPACSEKVESINDHSH